MKRLIVKESNQPRDEDVKRPWPKGEWDNEPDMLSWESDTGLYCYIQRHMSMGFLCGYVGVLPGHPFYDVYYDEFPVSEKYDATEDLAFSGRFNFERTEVPLDMFGTIWWIGFDFGHITDIIPALQLLREAYPGGTYKNIKHVEQECEKLAVYLKEKENENEN